MQDLDVGTRIRRIRSKLGLTQAQFAKRLGVIRGSIARYEAGSIPRLRLLNEIAKLGGVTVAWLLQGAEDSNKKMSLLGPRQLDLTEPLSAFLGFLERKAAALVLLPQQQRKQYEKRVKELLSRIRRELDEYQIVLEARLRKGGRRRAS
jgi:transcriptional regulator with XRE-family HTH domain